LDKPKKYLLAALVGAPAVSAATVSAALATLCFAITVTTGLVTVHVGHFIFFDEIIFYSGRGENMSGLF